MDVSLDLPFGFLVDLAVRQSRAPDVCSPQYPSSQRGLPSVRKRLLGRILPWSASASPLREPEIHRIAGSPHLKGYANGFRSCAKTAPNRLRGLAFRRLQRAGFARDQILDIPHVLL